MKAGDLRYALTADLAALLNHTKHPVKGLSEPANVKRRILILLKTFDSMVEMYGLKVSQDGKGGFGKNFKGRPTGILPEVLVHNNRGFFDLDAPKMQKDGGLAYASYDMGLTHEALELVRLVFSGKIKIPGLREAVFTDKDGKEISRLAAKHLGMANYQPFVDSENKLHQQVILKEKGKLELTRDLVDNFHTEARLFLTLAGLGLFGESGQKLENRQDAGRKVLQTMSMSYGTFEVGGEKLSIGKGDKKRSAWTEFSGRSLFDLGKLAPNSLAVSNAHYLLAAEAIAKKENYAVLLAVTAPGTGKEIGEYKVFGLDDSSVIVPFGAAMAVTTGDPKAVDNLIKLIELAKKERSYTPGFGLSDAYNPKSGKQFNPKIIFMNHAGQIEMVNYRMFQALMSHSPAYPFVAGELKGIDEKYPAPVENKPAAPQKEKTFDLLGLFKDKEKNYGAFTKVAKAGNSAEKTKKGLEISIRLDRENEFSGIYLKPEGGLDIRGYKTLRFTLGKEGKLPDHFKIEFKDKNGKILGGAGIPTPKLKAGETVEVDISKAAEQNTQVAEIVLFFDDPKHPESKLTVIKAELSSKPRSEARAERFNTIAAWLGIPALLFSAALGSSSRSSQETPVEKNKEQRIALRQTFTGTIIPVLKGTLQPSVGVLEPAAEAIVQAGNLAIVDAEAHAAEAEVDSQEAVKIEQQVARFSSVIESGKTIYVRYRMTDEVLKQWGDQAESVIQKTIDTARSLKNVRVDIEFSKNSASKITLPDILERDPVRVWRIGSTVQVVPRDYSGPEQPTIVVSPESEMSRTLRMEKGLPEGTNTGSAQLVAAVIAERAVPLDAATLLEDLNQVGFRHRQQRIRSEARGVFQSLVSRIDQQFRSEARTSQAA
jgi:hypothetical protein